MMRNTQTHLILSRALLNKSAAYVDAVKASTLRDTLLNAVRPFLDGKRSFIVRQETRLTRDAVLGYGEELRLTAEDEHEWVDVHYPLRPGDRIPPERKIVLCWVMQSALPFCGYIRYAGGDRMSPYFVVYHGNTDVGADVTAWCDCLPSRGPENMPSAIYNRGQSGERS
jgi:hypothetical protein